MKKKSFLKSKRPVEITTIAMALLVALSIISSSSMSATLNEMLKIKNLDLKIVEEKTSISVEPLTALAPEIKQKNLFSTEVKANNFNNIGSYMWLAGTTTIYGYTMEGPCYFNIGGDVTMLSNQTLPNFASGGTWTCDERWLVCNYGTGTLYEIDTETGDITEIGGGGVNLNALAYDKITNLIYGAGDTNLYLVDPFNGTQTYIAPFSGNGGNYIIGMAFDSDGVLYGWDVKSSGSSYLYTINTTTAQCTIVGSMGITLCFAQDGDFDRNNGDILYLTAFTISPNYGTYLYKCDKETGTCTLLGNLLTEIDASMIKSSCEPPDHDVGVTNISGPESGPAKTFPVNATVKNFGQNNECCFKTYVEIAELDISGWPILPPEYSDFNCIGEIDAGQEMNLTFANWTPAYLSEETSGTKIYSVKAWTDLDNPQDENPGNDLFSKIIELDFFHDVGIKEVTSPNMYIAPGNQNINAVIENIGTFPEQDMTCYAEIYEYITNCTNGILVYEDYIANIDIEQPLGGTETLIFDDYNFAIEGVYRLYLNLVNDNDDYPDNNQMTYLIGVDGTPPSSSHTLSPAAPNGDNGWYVSDVTVTLNAADPSIGCDMDGSGVKEIKYTINGVAGSVPGNTGTFKIQDDGGNIEVKYWAVDNVGNAESKHTFYINMDQTKPNVEPITWDAYRKGLTWYVKFTCQADDATSGMDRVEMHINDELNETITSPGPTYEFNIEWSSELKTAMFKFVAFDIAGNSDFVTIDGSDIKSNPISQNSQQSSNNQNLLVNLLLKQMAKTNR